MVLKIITTFTYCMKLRKPALQSCRLAPMLRQLTEQQDIQLTKIICELMIRSTLDSQKKIMSSHGCADITVARSAYC
jgi:delta-aminolevulinic acid dehydratase/porphobilinogen synthase